MIFFAHVYFTVVQGTNDMSILQKLCMAAIVIFTVSACSDDNVATIIDDTPDAQSDEFILIGEITLHDQRVELYTDKAFSVGYNRVYVKVYWSEPEVQMFDGHVTITPMMSMPEMQHSAPVENPGTTTPEQGLYTGAVIFMMPGSSTQQWTLNINVHNHESDSSYVDYVFPVDVAASQRTRVFTADDNQTYVVTLIEPDTWQVGFNDIEFTVHKRLSMTAFPPTDRVILLMEPTMPSMGHGSPNNIHPEHHGSGHYHGTVNFTMTGDWLITLQVVQNEILLQELEFDVAVQ